MITQWIGEFFSALVNFVLGLLPTVSPPSWLTDGSGYLATIWGYGAGLGAWIPWSLVGVVFAAVLVCIGIGFGIKVVRIVASFATIGGGSAG